MTMLDKVLTTLAILFIFGGGMMLDSADNSIPMVITYIGGILLAIEGWKYGRFR